jgi:drug/metabolite transporter (DMT)-like permease
MTRTGSNSPSLHPSPWAIALAFALVYLSWGTTYLAIREGVHHHHLPPGLFGGVRVSLAGWILLTYLRLRGERLRMPLREFFWISLSGIALFVFGNGLVTVAMDSIHSGMAAVLAATTPLWTALFEMAMPRGGRLSRLGWLGLFLGLVGVLVLLAPRLQEPAATTPNWGPFLVLGSSISWAVGSLILHYRERSGSHLAAAAYQMILGGTGLALVGLAAGEGQRLTPDLVTAGGLAAFFYLLIVGSLVGFVAFNWLLGHVPAAMVGTYAYVNPMVAILVGTLWGDGELTVWVVAGMVIILSGVALIRRGAVRGSRRHIQIETSEESTSTVSGYRRNCLTASSNQ